MSTFLEVLIPCLITLAGTVITCICTNSKTRTTMELKIEQLEKKVEKHNDLVERMYLVEKETALQDQRLDNLEKEIG